MTLHFKDDVQLGWYDIQFRPQKLCNTSRITIGHIDSDYSLRRIPGGKSLTSVDIVFNSSEILNLDPIAYKSY